MKPVGNIERRTLMRGSNWQRPGISLFTLLLAGCLITLGADQGPVSVFDSSSEAPISGAALLLSRADGAVLEAETDSEGRGVFPELRPGAYLLRAEQPGYVDLLDPHGRGRPMVVSAANKNPVTIGLTRASAISGQVFDGQGTPLQGANVYAIVRRGADGAPRYIQFGNLGHTDDNGKYRLHGLPPGHYSVAVVPFGTVSGFAPVFFPGSNSPGEAEFLELKPGETTSANLRVAAAEARSISGKLSGMPADASTGRAAVALMTRDGLQVAMSGAAADADGSFVLRDVPPGEYQLIAWTPHAGWDKGERTPGADARSAARSVSGVDLETGLELQPLAKVSGRLILDGATRTDYPCRGGKQIAFHSEDGWDNVWRLAVAVDGLGISVEGLPAGRYRIEMPGLGDSCRLTSVRVGDQSAPGGVALIDGSAPLTLVLATATGAVSGGVITQEDKPAAGIVVLSRTDGEGVAQVAQLDGEGRYGFSQVLAGEYRLTAMDGLNSADYLDSVEASKLGAKLVVVEAGQTTMSDMRITER
jgi:hypothetical protein